MASDPSKLSPSPSTPHTPLTPPLTPGTRQQHRQDADNTSSLLRFPLSQNVVTGEHFVMVRLICSVHARAYIYMQIQGIPKSIPHPELCSAFQVCNLFSTPTFPTNTSSGTEACLASRQNTSRPMEWSVSRTHTRLALISNRLSSLLTTHAMLTPHICTSLILKSPTANWPAKLPPWSLPCATSRVTLKLACAH
jgi:hypothetical protein